MRKPHRGCPFCEGPWRSLGSHCSGLHGKYSKYLGSERMGLVPIAYPTDDPNSTAPYFPPVPCSVLPTVSSSQKGVLGLEKFVKT